MPRPYDIEADWTLMTTCNFRCVYCFHTTDRLGAKIAPPAPVDQLARFFDESGYRWHLHLTGGEPFHYPGFLDLCRLLTRSHIISVNSNVDSPKVLEFARSIDPDRVDFINCAVHVQQRTDRNRLPAFIRHVRALRESGFDAYVTSVMYPEVFPLFLEHWHDLAAQKVVLWPKAFRGTYAGKRYPAAYTEAERAIITDYSLRAEAFYADQFSLRDDRPTIDPVVDRQVFLPGIPDFQGRACDAGHAMVRIDHRGNIYRCGSNTRLGNIVRGNFQRMPAAQPCDDHFCPYYCTKYSVPSNPVQLPPTRPVIELREIRDTDRLA